MSKKVCNKCLKEKDLKEFYKDKHMKDGHKSSCKECDNSKYECKCKICGKTFKSSHRNAVICSKECRRGEVKCKCDTCGKEIVLNRYKYEHSKNHFCSRECYYKFSVGENKHNYNSVKVNCVECGKEFKIVKSRYERSLNKEFCCSRECVAKQLKIKIKGENNPNFKGGPVKTKCTCCNKEIIVDRAKYNCFNSHFCNDECLRKYRSELWSGKNNPFFGVHRYRELNPMFGKKRPEITGSNNPNWNNTLTEEERTKRRKYRKYTIFIKEVLRRDNYTCQLTGIEGEGNLNVHHLNGFNWDIQHRTDVNNGITLLEPIHKLFHEIYGKGYNTAEQFEEFKQRYYNGEFKHLINI